MEQKLRSISPNPKVDSFSQLPSPMWRQGAFVPEELVKLSSELAFEAQTTDEARTTQAPQQTQAPPVTETPPHAETPCENDNKSRFLQWYQGMQGGQWGKDPETFDPAFVESTVRKLDLVFGENRYFGLDMKGLENLPDEPCLMVSNHSGGAAAPDVWGFLLSWHKHFQAKRPIHSLAHEMVLSIKATGEPFEKLGVLRARKDMAERVLRDYQRDIFVMPGGDVDVFRPYKVNFDGRIGYARLALKTGTPVAPVANAGAHDTLMVLTDGRPIARALKLNEIFRLKVFPIHLSFPWGLAIGPFPHLPPPSMLRYRVGAPVVPPTLQLAPGEEPPEALVREFDAKVQREVQKLLSELKAESVRPHQYMVDTCKRLYKKLWRKR